MGRKKYTKKLKARVALDAIKSQKTIHDCIPWTVKSITWMRLRSIQNAIIHVGIK